MKAELKSLNMCRFKSGEGHDHFPRLEIRHIEKFVICGNIENKSAIYDART